MRKYLLWLLSAALLLTGCTGPGPTESMSPADSTSAPSSVSQPASSAVQPLPVRFPPRGAYLEGVCDAFVPLQLPAERQISVTYYHADGSETGADFPLSAAQQTGEQPVMTLTRQQMTSAVQQPQNHPITGVADRQWILQQLDAAVYEPWQQDALPNLTLCLEQKGEQRLYQIYSDGSISTDGPDGLLRAKNATDYLKMSAIAYQYAQKYGDTSYAPIEWGWYAFAHVTPQYSENDPTPQDYLPDPAQYRLCLQTADWHTELDRPQAVLLLKTLFGENAGETYPGDSVPEFSLTPWDWTPPAETMLQLTEYYLQKGAGDRPDTLLQNRTLLLADGTAVRLPHKELTYFYHDGGIEVITPSWQRGSAAQNAFDPDMLAQCMAVLAEN